MRFGGFQAAGPLLGVFRKEVHCTRAVTPRLINGGYDWHRQSASGVPRTCAPGSTCSTNCDYFIRLMMACTIEDTISPLPPPQTASCCRTYTTGHAIHTMSCHTGMHILQSSLLRLSKSLVSWYVDPQTTQSLGGSRWPFTHLFEPCLLFDTRRPRGLLMLTIFFEDPM